MATPRLGTGAGLAALRAQAEHRVDWSGPGALRRVLEAPSIAEPRRGDVSAIVDTAGALAQQLDPLPNALAEIATRVRRHCAQRGHPPDEELIQQLDALRARTFELWKAARALSVAARGRAT